VVTRIDFDFHTKATPGQVVGLLTDFSPDRPAIWPQLSERWFEVYSVGETSADVREGQDSPTMWARELYDWSQPGTVTWTVKESSDLTPGSFVSVTATPAPDGGSDVHGIWERAATTLKGRAILVLMRLIGARMLTSYLRKVYDARADA
jgi:hypothetical protein